MNKRIFLLGLCALLCAGFLYFSLSDKKNDFFNKAFDEQNFLKDNKKIKKENNNKANFKKRKIAQSSKESLSSSGDEKYSLDKNEILSLLKELIDPSSSKQKWARKKLNMAGESIGVYYYELARDVKLDPLIRLQVVELMGEIKSKETSLMLRELLSGDDVIFKREVIRSMGKIGDKENIKDLEKHIDHEDPTLIAESLSSIYHIVENNEQISQNGEIEKNLIFLLNDLTSSKQGYEVLVKTNAIKVLAALQSEKAIDSIIKNFNNSKDEMFKHDIALVLISFSSSKARSLVEQYLKDLQSEHEKSLDPLIKGHLQLLINEVEDALLNSQN